MVVDTRRQMPEISKEALSLGQGTHQYYRQPDGWIKPALIGKVRDGEGAMQRTYKGRGWTPLPEYGRFSMTPYLLEHPLEPLFMAGGADAVTLDQIQQQGWDARPPSIPWCNTPEGVRHKDKFNSSFHIKACWEHETTVIFPQLEGVPPQNVEPCDFCERDDLPTEKARKQHMYVMHNKELSEIRMGQRMAEALSNSTRTMITANPYVCGVCNDGFESMRAFQEHVKLHRETDPS